MGQGRRAGYRDAVWDSGAAQGTETRHGTGASRRAQRRGMGQWRRAGHRDAAWDSGVAQGTETRHGAGTQGSGVSRGGFSSL